MSATDQNEASLDFLRGIEPEVPEQEPAAETALSPIELLLDLSWKAIADAPKLDTLSAGPPLAVIIHVPSDAWIDLVHDRVHQNAAPTMIIDGKTGKRDWRSQEVLIVDALERGKSVVGIAADPDVQLPPLLRGAADLLLTVPAPTPDLVREAIRTHTGRVRVQALSAMDIAGLDLHDLAAALRPGATPKACIARLQAASATRSVSMSTDTTPLLHDLCGYGAARDWCLATLADIEAVRAGALPAGELESAVFFGPPGTGKTTLARSLAKSARIPLVETSVAAWFQHREGHLGDFLHQVHDMFARAKNSAPCILFIDELDSLQDRSQLY
jgi:cell division protease FtsH